MRITIALCLTAIILALLARGHSLHIRITHELQLPTKHQTPNHP